MAWPVMVFLFTLRAYISGDLPFFNFFFGIRDPLDKICSVSYYLLSRLLSLHFYFQCVASFCLIETTED